VVAVLVGVAVRRGALSLTDPVSRWLGPGWSRAPRAAERRITVRHLLTMTSGLDDDLRLLAPAGAQWRYTNAAYHRLHPTLEAATGRTLSRFSQEALFGPIGMSSARWQARGAGEHEGESGLVMTPRDMARFGLLVLAGTRWAGRPPVVQSAYLRAALSTSQRHNPSYGYLWWLNGKPSYRVGADPRSRPGPIIPAAPTDLVAALGAADQKIYVVPSLDLVAVRQGARGGPPGLGRTGFDNAWWARLRPAAPGAGGA
jgi:CubicO group peptidase (beta-lactamase class C family)